MAVLDTLLNTINTFKSPSLLVLGTLVLACVVQVIIKLAQVFYGRFRDARILKDFTGPAPHWLTGNLRRVPLGKGMVKRLELMKRYESGYLMHMGPAYRQISVHSPDHLQTVMSTAEPKDPIGYDFLRPWIGDGLLISRGKKWVRNRRLLTPAFHFDILKPYQALFSKSANAMISKWNRMLARNEKESFELFEHVSLMTLDSLMKCIFGLERNFQEEGERDPYISTVYELSELVSRRFRTFYLHNDLIYYFTYQGYKFRKAAKFAQAFTKDVIETKRREKLKNQDKPRREKKYVDFLDVLLDCRDDKGNGLSDQEIQDEVDTFMFEGHDTTASGISWCLFNLASHPEYQQRCRKEIQATLGDRTEVEWDDLPELKYLTMCIKESLRTHPPVTAIGRITTKPMKLHDGRTIPEGVWIGMHIYCCHYDPKLWPDPETYDPERFSPENSQGRHPHAFVPFSAGPRNCIGQHFAMNEMKTIIALVLKNFKLSIDETKPAADPFVTLILRAKEGVWVNLEPVQ